MPRSCFDGYLTDGCVTCPDWADGSDPSKGFGCACHFPIMECEHFRKMYEEEEGVASNAETCEPNNNSTND